MGNRRIINLVNGHLRDFEIGNFENLCRDWTNSPISKLTLPNKSYRGYDEVMDGYKNIIEKYPSRKLRLTDFRLDILANMACINVYYEFVATTKDNEQLIRKNKGEIILELENNIWQFVNVKLK